MLMLSATITMEASNVDVGMDTKEMGCRASVIVKS